MNWALFAIEALQRGESPVITPHGNSMKGRVNDGDKVTLQPVTEINVDDIVLVKVSGSVYLHLVKAIDGERYQIGNNKGGINGWVKKAAIYGKAIKIES